MKDKRKTKILSLFVISILTISTLIAILPTSIAQEIPSITTYPYVIASPNPAGVNEGVLLIFGITHYLYEYPDGWEGITITITSPDGTTETLGPYKTDPTGATGALYTPTMVGTYKIKCNFPEQVYDWPRQTRAPTLLGPILYESSVSEEYELAVEVEASPSYPGHSLPTEYWTRPIDGQLREWTSIAGNWLAQPDQKYAPYNQGPETAHILWAEPLVKGGMSSSGGGVVGGYTAETTEIDQRAYEDGDAYEGLFTPRSSPVIMGGVLYFNRYNANGGTRVEQEVVAVDIHTGEELWVRNWGNRTLAFGQLFYWDSFNYHGTFQYLWSTVGSTWNCYEASTGRWVYSYSDVPSGSRLYGPNGEIIIYTIDMEEGWITKWNSTHVKTEKTILEYGPTGSNHGSWMRRFEGTTIDGTLGIMWNVSIPKNLPGRTWTTILDDMVVGNEIYGSGFHYMLGDMPNVFWAISLKPGQEGTLLYNVTWQKPLGDVAMWRVAVSKEDRVFVMQCKELRQLYGFDLDNGQLLWGPTDPMDFRSIYSYTGYVVDGKLYYVQQFAGRVYCYNIKTGQVLWTYEAPDPYGASEGWQKEFGGDMWPIEICFITDGKVYITHSEHSANNPLPRGAPLICVDADTGEEIFRANGILRQTRWGGRHLIGDSIIVGMDTYDQRVYAIGKGPSQTTLETPFGLTTLGYSYTISGSVMDVSPGTQSSSLKLRFPNGVPAVSDASMSEWMLYVYKQFEMPAATGVTVKMEAVDPNGNYQNYGTVTTDPYGNFGFSFEPEVPGQYMLIATFEGSDSYYGSTDTTYITVNEASTPATPIEPEQPTEPEQPAAETLISAELAIIAAVAVIAVIGVAAYWMIRKRK